MKFPKFPSKFIIAIIVSSTIIIVYLLFSLRNMTSKKNELSRELSYLNVILDYSVEDLQIKKRIMGRSFRKSIVNNFFSQSNQEPKYYIVVLEGIMVKKTDLVKLINYLISQFNEDNVQIIASVSEMKTLLFKNKFNNDDVYITSSFYSQLNEIVDIGFHDIPILLLDGNGVCIYTFLFHYNCFIQVIENGKIVSSIINSSKYECKN